MPAVRALKILMVASLALWAAVVAYGNIVDYGSNFQFVRHVLSMDDTLPGNTLRQRAITTPWMWHAAYALIIAMEAATAAALAVGAAAMVRAWQASGEAFDAAKHWCMVGVGIGFCLWFTGFMVVGGEWFAMWQSHVWNGQQAAFRFYATLLGVAIFVNQRDGSAG